MNLKSNPKRPRGGAADPFFRLRLFVAGDEPHSLKARETLFRLCREHLKDRCEINVVDVLQDYRAALDCHVMAVPTLIIETPPPERVIVGSLSDEDKVLAVLGIARGKVRP